MSNLTHQQRGDIKDYVATLVSEEWIREFPDSLIILPSASDRYNWDNWISGKTAPYLKVNSLLATWASHSAQHIQDCAEQTFFKQQFNSITAQILKVVYDITQAELKARGIRYIKLYRGQQSRIHSFRPLSSSSTALHIARNFAQSQSELVYEGSIPARYIGSTFFTGYGCAEEQEYVVLSSRGLRSHWNLVGDSK